MESCEYFSYKKYVYRFHTVYTNVVAAIIRKRAAKIATHLQLKAAIFASLQK